MERLLLQVLDFLNTIILVYFVSTNAVYTVLMVLSIYSVTLNSRFSGTKRHLALKESPAPPSVTLLVPAFNEGVTVVETVRSLLSLDYPDKKIIAIDDGSTDDTLTELIRHFDLVPIDLIYKERLKANRPSQFFRNPAQPDLLIVTKPNGGKSDALNVGLNLTDSEYCCSVDADSVVENDSLLRLVYPIVESKIPIVVSGGVIRILNGCHLQNGRVVRIDLPTTWLERCQIVEYFRTFFFGRPGWNFLKATFICSGAFALFHTETVKEAGGFGTDTVTEDIDLIASLHRYLCDQGRAYGMTFTSDPVCWTEAPKKIGALGSQRRRWHLGLTQTVMKHNRMIFSRRYGAFGTLSMPFHAYVEAMGCVFEALGTVIVPFSFLIGAMPFHLFWLITFFAIGFGTLLSVGSILMQELTMRRYPTLRNLMILLAYSIIESFGYRQIVSFFRAHGVIKYFLGFKGWEVVVHTGAKRVATN